MQSKNMIGCQTMKQVILVVKEPTNMDDLVYCTRRNLGNDGFAMAWVHKGKCPKCKKGIMGKPRDPKTGKPKIRAKEYVCPECKFTIEKKEYEESLTCEMTYTCPHCKAKGEASVPFIRKRVQRVDPETGKKKPLDVVRAQCSNCDGNIDITKKLK